MYKGLLIALVSLISLTNLSAQQRRDFSVIAYYTGNDKQIDQFEINKLSHIIFSFCHLKDGELHVDNAKDSTTIQYLVSLKKNHPKLKIMLSLGGWGGCEPCSEAFSTSNGRTKFARSVKKVNDYFDTDGIDLDWEYPTIEGHPGHLYQAQDKQNFTALIQELRQVLGSANELSFAAGGFQKYLDESVEWEKIMPLVDRVNIMSYDLVNGYATVTGHHTPIFSTHDKEESTDRAVQFLLKKGIPANKLVIGAAFYTRVWEHVNDVNNGLYQAGRHRSGYDFKSYATNLTTQNEWAYFWDEKAQAPYWYNKKQKLFATGDNLTSVKAKTKYALDNKLGGIMFWELTLDTFNDGMLNAIDQVVKQ
uniref:chitinase n=1 Tax=Sphingobacterium sp. (strain 21) TaxID=743722 RepID=F4C1H4_SPHS2